MQTINHTLPIDGLLSSLLPPVGEPTIRQTRMDIHDDHAFLAYEDGSVYIDQWEDDHTSNKTVSSQYTVLSAVEAQHLKSFLERPQTKPLDFVFTISDPFFAKGYNSGKAEAREGHFGKGQPLTSQELIEGFKDLIEEYNETHDERALQHSIGALAGIFSAR